MATVRLFFRIECNCRLYKPPKVLQFSPRSKERWSSGLWHLIRNQKNGNTFRGFKSHPLRHLVRRDRLCAFIRIHGVFWVSSFLVFRMLTHR